MLYFYSIIGVCRCLEADIVWLLCFFLHHSLQVLLMSWLMLSNIFFFTDKSELGGEFEGSDSLDTIDVTQDSNSEEDYLTRAPDTEELDPGK